jgi:hypothetical protein
MYPFRCSRTRPHRPHHVKAVGDVTAFDCPGWRRGEFDRLLNEAFGS